MTLLNVPGATLVPHAEPAVNRKGKAVKGRVVTDMHTGLRLLMLGFFATTVKELDPS